MNKNDTRFRDSHYNNIVKKNISSYRRAYGFNQQELADMINYTKEQLSQIESIKSKNNCPIYILGRIVELFDASFKDFFYEHEEVPQITGLKAIIHDDDYYYNVIRKNVRRCRNFRGYSQINLSLAIGSNKGYFAKFETSNKSFSIATLGRISDVLRVPIENFFEDVDVKQFIK